MTSKIEKELQKFTKGERNQVKMLLSKIKASDYIGLDIRKLKGHDDIFRVRKGRLRIIFKQSKSIKVLAIERRTEKTYKKY